MGLPTAEAPTPLGAPATLSALGRARLAAAAASPVASPILELVEAVQEETRLTRLYDALESISAEDIAANSGGLADKLGDTAMKRVYGRSGVFQRVVLDSIAERGKAQNRVGNAVAEDSQRPAFYNNYSEVNHHETTSFSHWGEKFANIILQDPDDHPQILKRQAVTAELMKKAGVPEIPKLAASALPASILS
jgi:hypothetical protein